MAQEMAFHRLDIDDLPQLVRMEHDCFDMPWNEDQFRLGLEGKVFKVFGFKQGATLCAYLSFYHVGDTMEVLNLAVDPALRRRGVGTRLLGLVLQICHKMGIKSARLEVRRSNVAAQHLYTGQGFSPAGVHSGYYPDNGEDALLMALNLTDKK